MVLLKGNVDENGNYLFPQEQELNFQDIQAFVDNHKEQLHKKYLDNLHWYKAKPPNNVNSDQNHNHLVANMDKYLVDTLNGFFVGIPPTIKVEDKATDQALQDWLIPKSQLYLLILHL